MAEMVAQKMHKLGRQAEKTQQPVMLAVSKRYNLGEEIELFIY